jgi:uncharacterized protein YjbI with pentapeptide repeats
MKRQRRVFRWSRPTYLKWEYWRLKQSFLILLQGWVKDAKASFKRKGYVLIATLIATCVGVYSIQEARHERRANRALFERSTFMTMVASGNRGTFIAAMKMFGPVLTMTVPRDPHPFAPWTWFFGQEAPNQEPLRLWAVSFFPLCTAEMCGIPDGTFKASRIDLRGADLRGADLHGVDLHEANLFGANLTRAFLRSVTLSEADLRDALLPEAHLHGAELDNADLSEANFFRASLPKSTLSGAKMIKIDLREADLCGASLAGANLVDAMLGKANLRETMLYHSHLDYAGLGRADLRGATLYKTDLNGAFLSGANLGNADLRGVLNLTQEELNTTFVDNATKLPENFTRPQSFWLVTLYQNLIRPKPCPPAPS